MTDFEERPVKKRRFFVEDSSEPQFLPHPSEDSKPAVPKPGEGDDRHSNGGSKADSNNAPAQQDGFDRQLFETFVGEELPAHDLERLKGMAGDDTPRGRLRLRDPESLYGY